MLTFSDGLLLVPYSYSGTKITMLQQRQKNTFKYLHPEVQRRFEGLQLCVAVEESVTIGVGTGQRVQLPNQPNHAEPGNSHHEDFPASENPPKVPEHGAVAIDVVGDPSHEEGWTAMEKHLRTFGFTSFTIPSIKANWSTHMGRAYTGSWDRPHIQPTEIPYSRNYRMTPYPLQKWALPPEYDPEVVDVKAFFSGGDNPEPEPSQEDDMTDAQAALLQEIRDAATATNENIWVGEDSLIGRLEKLKWLPSQVEQILARLDALEA